MELKIYVDYDRPGNWVVVEDESGGKLRSQSVESHLLYEILVELRTMNGFLESEWNERH